MPAADAIPVLITRHLAVPAAAVNTALAVDPAVLFGATGGPGIDGGGRHHVPLEVRFAGVRFDRLAAVGFGPVIEEDDGTRVLPLWWEAADQPHLFPTFVGGLEVRSHGDGAELRLQGHYRPPLGAAGGLVNRTILNKAATASLETLLDRLAGDLAATASRPLVPGP